MTMSVTFMKYIPEYKWQRTVAKRNVRVIALDMVYLSLVPFSYVGVQEYEVYI
jgi:hypothetical protein